jgi:HEAT repeat protein
VIAGKLMLCLLLSGRFSWPGALEADGRALAEPPAVSPAPSEAQRLAAISRLVVRYGTAAAAPFLRPLLTDREPAVRLVAARLLARAGDPAAGAAATAWIVRPVVPLVDRTFGLDVLGYAPTLSPAARQAVEQAARDPEAMTRAHALEVFDRHPVGSSLPVVLRALDDDNRDVRLLAVRLAEAAGDPRAVLSLLERLEDGDRQIRLRAISAVGRLRDPRVAPALLRLTAEGTIDVRAAAIDALGALKVEAAVPSLDALARRRSDDLARHADLALGEIASPAAVAALTAALRRPPVADEVRIALRRAGPAAVAGLIGEIEHGTSSSAAIAAATLGQIGDRRATAALCTAIERETGGAVLALSALDALARLSDPAAVAPLVRAAEAPDLEIRRRAFAALVATADPRSIVVLDRGLADPDARVRTLAARLAGAIGARAVAPALAIRIGDADPGARRAAAEALALIGDASGALVAAALDALSRSGAPILADDESEAIGDALERIVSPADADRLSLAFGIARGGARAAIARGLAASAVERPLTDQVLIGRLIAAVGEGGLVALAAADALARARIPAGAVGALASAFGDAEAMVRARLCPAIANTADGGAWLAALVAADDQPIRVRAAAAWAARGQAQARAALEAAAGLAEGPLAANARAALAAGARPGTTWTAARLRGSDGQPLIGRWVTIAGADGLAVQAMTDGAGVARLSGLPGGRLELYAADLTAWRDGP